MPEPLFLFDVILDSFLPVLLSRLMSVWEMRIAATPFWFVHVVQPA